jgi:multidrug efflux pump subunit AcrA (membrane-fusion protein)
VSHRPPQPFIVGAASVLLAVSGCARGDNASQSNETALVEQRNMAATVIAIGALRPQIGAEVRVGSRISGRVQRLRANIGDRVTKGQVIAELETAELDAIVAEREAQLRLADARLAAQDTSSPEGLARAAAEVARASATEQLTAAELDRRQQLLATLGTTAADVEAARERHLVARAQLSTARREFDLAQREARAEHAGALAALERARVERSFTVIRAPISGTIASVATQGYEENQRATVALLQGETAWPE